MIQMDEDEYRVCVSVIVRAGEGGCTVQFM